MRLKELESHLSSLDGFTYPKIQLEQYETRPHIAARCLYAMEHQFGDLVDKVVADFGCGFGMLSIGAIMLGAGAVVGFDIDPDALALARSNADDFAVDNLDLVHCDLLAASPQLVRPRSVDTVVMNPPFGTKGNAGIDMAFLRRGIETARGACYSLHKTSTRAHILRKAKEWGVVAQVVAELRYDLPATYGFHRKATVDIAVDLLRFDCSLPEQEQEQEQEE